MFDPSQQFNYLAECGITEVVKYGPDVPSDTDYSRWICIYGQYINVKKTAAEGRRISKSKSVLDPTVDEMGQICAHFNLPYVIESAKSYPRDWMTPGRIRVCLRDEGRGQPLNQEVPTKKALLLKMGELIPKLKSRCLPPPAARKRTGTAGTGATSSCSKHDRRRK